MRCGLDEAHPSEVSTVPTLPSATHPPGQARRDLMLRHPFGPEPKETFSRSVDWSRDWSASSSAFPKETFARKVHPTQPLDVRPSEHSLDTPQPSELPPPWESPLIAGTFRHAPPDW